MACPEFADLLVDYQDLDDSRREALDSHLAVCTSCKAFVNALNEVDATLTSALTGLEAQVSIRQVMYQPPLRRPSFIPVVLDLTASIAVLAVVLIVLNAFFADSPLNVSVYLVAAILFVGSALVVGYRSLADLKN